MELTVRDMGGGVVREERALVLPAFKGNHNNLAKELAHYQQKLQERQH
jgi:hypothetical protein